MTSLVAVAGRPCVVTGRPWAVSSRVNLHRRSTQAHMAVSIRLPGWKVSITIKSSEFWCSKFRGVQGDEGSYFVKI